MTMAGVGLVGQMILWMLYSRVQLTSISNSRHGDPTQSHVAQQMLRGLN